MIGALLRKLHRLRLAGPAHGCSSSSEAGVLLVCCVWLVGWLVGWCGRQELNLHIFRYQLLRLARLPIPPRPQGMTAATLIAESTYAVAISQETPMLRNYVARGTYPDPHGFARYHRFNRHDSRR